MVEEKSLLEFTSVLISAQIPIKTDFVIIAASFIMIKIINEIKTNLKI